MGHYAIAMADGSVAVMQTFGEATVEACLAQWPEVERAKVQSHRPIDPGAIPKTRDWRDAWMLAADRIEIDMKRAREIKRVQLRRERAPLLASLDVDYQRADETGDAAGKARIAKAKAALRDAPAHPAIASAATPDDLTAITLNSLI